MRREGLFVSCVAVDIFFNRHGGLCGKEKAKIHPLVKKSLPVALYLARQ